MGGSVASTRLHGFNAKASAKKEDLMKAPNGALSSELDGTPEVLLQLEQNLERKFMLQNEEARGETSREVQRALRINRYSPSPNF